MEVSREELISLLSLAPPERGGIVMPASLTPAWCKRVESAVWDPGKGTPWCWIHLVRFCQEDGVVSATLAGYFMAPDELIDLEFDWVPMGCWFMGLALNAIGRHADSLATREGAESARDYTFEHENVPIGIIRFTPHEAGVKTIPFSWLASVLAAHVAHAGSMNEVERLNTSLLPKILDQNFRMRFEV